MHDEYNMTGEDNTDTGEVAEKVTGKIAVPLLAIAAGVIVSLLGAMWGLNSSRISSVDTRITVVDTESKERDTVLHKRVSDTDKEIVAHEQAPGHSVSLTRVDTLDKAMLQIRSEMQQYRTENREDHKQILDALNKIADKK